MKLTIGNHEIDLDEANLTFNETNINEYLQKEASLYNYYSEILHKATYILTTLEDEYENLYHHKFVEFKEGGGSDKLAESKARIDEGVIESLKKVRKAKVSRDIVNSYLRSMDKGHDDILNMSYNLRKEMDKIFTGIKGNNSNDNWSDTVNKADEIVRKK